MLSLIWSLKSRLQRLAKSLAKENRSLRCRYLDKWSMTLREWLLYHQKEVVFGQAKWRGTPIWKSPLDAWILQELVYEVSPEVIIEIGSGYGGSTKFLADLLDLAGRGIVVSIDIDRSKYQVSHKRVFEITGNSSEVRVIEKTRELCSGRRTMVVHDGGHAKQQVLKDLENYSPFVSVGSYFVVEDGIVDLFCPGDGLGFEQEGPLSAIEEFIARNPSFQVDESRERYILTYNPKGFLRRVS